MNFVEIVLDSYSHITLHVFQVFASYTHYTSYSLLNLVYYTVCNLVMAIQDYMFLDFDAKWVLCLCCWDKKCEKLVFGRSGQNTSVFEKHFISYSCILFIKYYTLRSLCIKLLCFSYFQSIECDFQSIEKFQIFQVQLLLNQIGIRSMLNRSKLKNFQFLSI